MTLGRATLRLYGDLADLAEADRAGEVSVPVAAGRSVKDAIESTGVPHTEVELVLVNGTSVGFDRRLRPGDRVAVYPPFAALDVDAVSRVRPEPRQPRFVADVHLGRLAERLRLLGFDTDYRNDRDDAELAELAASERRWLLTRDRGLLMRTSVTHGYLVRSSDPDQQVVEVVRRFDLADAFSALSRCARCNGTLIPVDKAEVVDQLEPRTREAFDDFVRCDDCGRLYWRGSHHRHLAAFVDRVTERGDRDG